MTLMHPSAIWLYLAQFFTRDVLAQLMIPYTTRASLSDRVAASLEELYHDVDFRFLHLADGTARRLRKRPVADRVRVLSIGPYFVCDALDSGQPFGKTAQIVADILARFRNTEKYRILWHERPTATLRRPAPKYDHLPDILCLASTFLVIPFSSAQYLRILTVECSLDKAEHLFSPTIVLPRLEEFNLCIRDDDGADLDAAGYTMIHHIARFLNNVDATLRSLSFETSLVADFSPLFMALGFFAHLSKLSLCIPTSTCDLGDPSALKAFLHQHHYTLEHLSLRAHLSRRQRGADTDAGWLSECLTGVTFCKLQTLSVGTSFIPRDVVVLCIQQWADTLSDLDITGDYLSYEQLEDLLGEFEDGELTSLTVGVTCLCPELVDMLAEHLPDLTRLNLRIQSVAPHRLAAPRVIGVPRKLTDSDPQLERFCAEMSSRNYPGWNLQDISVWKFTKKLQYHGRCVDAIRDSLGQV
ncbi:hypothetical protein B0H16DRAFT_955477 [Mycena metata]|uniref:F-box domain-containing protein n=1 Tax=Mycena metata TaxID=1033252 RepID=A0AAD7NW00_9AGAR|nr:hypothetical protein B0H16DRAFT_955477 [Mycena metata]